MENTVTLKSIFIVYVALVCHASLSKSDPLEESSTAGFTPDLIHTDSPQSPSYDASLSPYERTINALRRSHNRARRLSGKQTKDTPESDIIAAQGDYLMKYSVGTPPVPSLGVADTGSDLIWTQCQSCLKCFNQSLPLFNPNSSSTYREIALNTPRCSSISYSSKTGKTCFYTVVYGDGSFSGGELAIETFALASSAGLTEVFLPEITFGCGFVNGGTFSGVESGIVGLGGGKESLVQQLGPLARGKFSYCLIPVSDPSKSSKLNFGANAEISGNGVISTPIVKKKIDTFYYLTLEGVGVGNQTLEFLSDIGQREEGNIIIDSGTTLTYLPPGFYTDLERAIKSRIKLKQIKDPTGQLNLCYLTREDRLQVPEITFHFRGADVKWKNDNVFVRTSDVSLCLAAAPDEGLAIYGNLAQMNFLVGYDLEKRTVSFMPTDCRKY